MFRKIGKNVKRVGKTATKKAVKKAYRTSGIVNSTSFRVYGGYAKMR